VGGIPSGTTMSAEFKTTLNAGSCYGIPVTAMKRQASRRWIHASIYIGDFRNLRFWGSFFF
jgi:hypothetical protein